MLVEERKRYLFHFVHLANVRLLLFTIVFCSWFVFLQLSFSQSDSLLIRIVCVFHLYRQRWSEHTHTRRRRRKKKKLKFRPCFASINAWLANFAHKIALSYRSKMFSNENDVHKCVHVRCMCACVPFLGNFRLQSKFSTDKSLFHHREKKIP